MSMDPTPIDGQDQDKVLHEMRATAKNRIQIQTQRWGEYRRQKSAQMLAASKTFWSLKMVPWPIITQEQPTSIEDNLNPPKTGSWKRPRMR